MDEAKLYVLSTWSRWGLHSVLAGLCLAVNVLFHFLDKVLCAHSPGLTPLFSCPGFCLLLCFQRPGLGLFICGFLKHMAIKCLLPGWGQTKKKVSHKFVQFVLSQAKNAFVDFVGD